MEEMQGIVGDSLCTVRLVIYTPPMEIAAPVHPCTCGIPLILNIIAAGCAGSSCMEEVC